MIKVRVEVHEEDARFSLPVQAESINRAVTIMKERHPSRDVRVVFPIDPQEFFAEGSKETGTERRQTATAPPPFPKSTKG